MASKSDKERRHLTGYEDGIKGKWFSIFLPINEDIVEGQRQGYEDHLRNKDLAERIATERVTERIVEKEVTPSTQGRGTSVFHSPDYSGIEVFGVAWLGRVISKLRAPNIKWSCSFNNCMRKYSSGVFGYESTGADDCVIITGYFLDGEIGYNVRIDFNRPHSEGWFSEGWLPRKNWYFSLKVDTNFGYTGVVSYSSRSSREVRIGIEFMGDILRSIEPEEERKRISWQQEEAKRQAAIQSSRDRFWNGKEKTICPYGHKVEKHYRFCGKCGVPLSP